VNTYGEAAFGYAEINDPSIEPKPTVYFADWVPIHVEDGIIEFRINNGYPNTLKVPQI
jgi:hypothetical protein